MDRSLGSGLLQPFVCHCKLFSRNVEIAFRQRFVEILDNGFQMILDSSVRCGLFRNDADSFLGRFDICHTYSPHFHKISQVEVYYTPSSIASTNFSL